MKCIVCVSKNNGMLFNNRRQSRDITIIEDILKNIGTSKLYINEFSKGLFYEKSFVDKDFLDNAENNDFCFVENIDLTNYKDKIDTLIIYRWNRDYPADFFFELDLSSWKLKSKCDFSGNSHPKITKEVYKNEK